MSMSVEQMKMYILARYNFAPAWRDKVARMSDDQIIAIYYRMLNSK